MKTSVEVNDDLYPKFKKKLIDLKISFRDWLEQKMKEETQK